MSGQSYPSAYGPQGRPGMRGVQSAFQGKGGECMQDGFGCGSFRPSWIFQNQPNVGPQMCQSMFGGHVSQGVGPQFHDLVQSGGNQFSGPVPNVSSGMPLFQGK